ncbi:MAG: cyclase, partial [Mycobacterium sp.]|nr:cyclase [Mycobacterium sp.]
NTRVKFDITINPLVPLPGFLIKRTIKGVVDTSTEGLRKRVLSVKKGR